MPASKIPFLQYHPAPIYSFFFFQDRVEGLGSSDLRGARRGGGGSAVEPGGEAGSQPAPHRYNLQHPSPCLDVNFASMLCKHAYFKRYFALLGFVCRWS